ncbi:alpha/beta hydrolase [Jannaschia sp. Os4]|uniref:alpha/beta hydrolase n=1 Tax=Jannaschia sp. Os4 TaxID=2807617 RepID=UPI0019393168|nr:alpha/beta hydrolase [Jannaschia sp. Os4]MBM2574673.1 alpha/beta hydrolase [Jannaschia sp. Os4]
MGRLVRGFLWVVAGAALAAAALWAVGPREPIETADALAFDASVIPEDVEGWLADREGQVADLRPESAKQILWHRGAGVRTDLAVVYVHGFSADPWEVRPVPELVAERLGANLHFARLTGHGRDGDAMAEASAGDWLRDYAEAVAVGRRIGERVIVVSASTGGTISALVAGDPDLAPLHADVAGIAMISPNFAISNPAAALLTWPAARAWVPAVAGPVRSFDPVNDRHARHWTTTYPTVATLPMAALVARAGEIDWGRAETPALFVFSPDDTVVRPEATEAVAAAWGGPATVERVTVGEGDDPYAHVVAGDILSPSRTAPTVDLLARWAEAL